MNTCIVCLGEDNNAKLIEYNHCGLYHIHSHCLNRWNKDECIICREKIVTINSSDEDDNFNCKLCITVSTLCPILSATVCALFIIFI